MKTNQIFNFNRFGRYAKSTFALNFKQTMMMWGVIVTSIFVLSLVVMSQSSPQWNKDGWIPLFLGNYFGAGIIYAGLAFSQFRSKEKTIMSLMVPVTPFERFLYEFIEKIASFILLYPILFWIFSSLAVFVSNAFPAEINLTMWVRYRWFPFETISYHQLYANTEEGLIAMFFSLSIFLFLIAFAGSATFRKYPLVKTIVFCGAVVAIIAGYFYIMIDKLDLHNPWISNIGENFRNQQGLNLLTTVMLIFSIFVLIFAYFKLKEKEVQ